jgi:amino acid transporter
MEETEELLLNNPDLHRGDELFNFDETVPNVPLSSTIQQKEVVIEKTFNAVTGTSLIIGVIIGSGIFASPGPVLSYTQSVGASLVVWTVSGLIAMTGGLCYAELGTMIPLSGGEHPYLMRAFGSVPAFLFSWTGILASRPGSISIIATICSEYIVRLIFGQDKSKVLKKIISLFIIWTLTFINIRSTKSSTKLQDFTTLIKLLAIFGISLTGLIRYYNNDAAGALSQPLFANSSQNPGNYSLALFAALWAYDGW